MPELKLTAQQREELPKALDRRRRVARGEFALEVYIPLTEGRQYTSFAGKIVSDMQTADMELLALSYVAIAEECDEMKQRLASEIDVDADQIIAMAGVHWVNEQTKKVHSDNRKMKKSLKAVLARAGDEWKTDGNIGHHVALTLTVRE